MSASVIWTLSQVVRGLFFRHRMAASRPWFYLTQCLAQGLDGRRATGGDSIRHGAKLARKTTNNRRG